MFHICASWPIKIRQQTVCSICVLEVYFAKALLACLQLSEERLFGKKSGGLSWIISVSEAVGLLEWDFVFSDDYLDLIRVVLTDSSSIDLLQS